MKMRQVYQNDDNGCWIACVSMLTGEPYRKIRDRYKFHGDVTGRSAGPIVELLHDLGFSCDKQSTKLSKIGSLKVLDENALVYTKNLDEDGDETGGHWMVWDSKLKVLRDPEGWSADRRRTIKNFRVVKATVDARK